METNGRSNGVRSNTEWEQAGRFIAAIGSISSAISSCIRTLKLNNAPDAPRGGYDDGGRFELRRFLKANSIKIPVFHHAQSRFTDELKKKSYIGGTDLLELYSAHEFCALLALIYLYKRLIIKNPDREEADRIGRTIEEQVEIGSLLGTAIPSLDYADALMIGGIRGVALGLIALKDPKGFKEYRRDNKIKDVTFNLEDELRRWQCTHIDIAAQLLVQLGFGKELPFAMRSGLLASSDRSLAPEALRVRLLGFWIESLHRGVSPPSIRGEEKFTGSQHALDSLLDQSIEIRKNGVSCPWLSKGKKDISRETHPQLFSAKKGRIQEDQNDEEFLAGGPGE